MGLLKGWNGISNGFTANSKMAQYVQAKSDLFPHRGHCCKKICGLGVNPSLHQRFPTDRHKKPYCLPHDTRKDNPPCGACFYCSQASRTTLGRVRRDAQGICQFFLICSWGCPGHIIHPVSSCEHAVHKSRWFTFTTDPSENSHTKR